MFVYTAFQEKPLVFDRPKAIISCFNLSGIEQAFSLMESWLDKGYYIAGFLSYESGYGFEDKLADKKEYVFPLVYMGCYELPYHGAGFCKESSAAFRISDIKPSISFNEYSKDISAIRAFIADGDVYQITYCIKMKFVFEGSTSSLFSTLLREQPVPYPAYIKTDNFTILSLSPEMFMKKNGATIYTKPMKGTWQRGNNIMSDIISRFRLKYDEKNRAENVMITDLLRNDLGRIGSNVRVNRLFEVEPYVTLYQMTSTISADIEKYIPLYELFKAVFPSGSVTGAPKIRAMEIIRDIEREERKIYTGAIGFITPDRDLFFNVPIRTMLIEGCQGEIGVGGGIIWDSTSEGEWAEVMLKAKFLTVHSQ